MKQPLISCALISLSISIMGLTACGTNGNLNTINTSDNRVQSNGASGSSIASISNSSQNISGSESDKNVQIVSQAEFDRLKNTPSFTIIDEAQIKRSEEEKKKNLENNQNIINEFLKNNPQSRELFSKEPSKSDPNIKFLNDGNYLLKIKNSTGEEQNVTTLGNEFKLGAIAASIKNFPTYENQLALYTNVFYSLPDDEKEPEGTSLSLKATTYASAPPTINNRVVTNDRIIKAPVINSREIDTNNRIVDNTTNDTNNQRANENNVSPNIRGNEKADTTNPSVSDNNRAVDTRKELFPRPETLAKMDVKQISDYNTKIAKRLYEIDRIKYYDLTKPFGYVSDPAKEEGVGTGNDRTNSANTSCTTPRANGIYKNYNWANKYYVTSIKNQGSRGTCVAFAITSADEMKIAKNNNKWVNLSEQDYYYKNKAVWWPSNYGDGLDTFMTWNKLKTTGYRMPYENDWNYNPSYSRIGDDETTTYTHSCDGYGEECSDTNHQGKKVCIDLPTGRVCGTMSGGTSSNPYTLSGNIHELWDFSNTDLSISLTAIHLALGHPVVISLSVTPSFDSPDANGYVHYNGGSEASRGGHALHVSGFISNEVLAQKIPSAPAGEGGGYFIVKNSWGACFADTGYIYLPFEWVKKYAYSMTVRN